jgi:hypothetical protein
MSLGKLKVVTTEKGWLEYMSRTYSNAHEGIARARKMLPLDLNTDYDTLNFRLREKWAEVYGARRIHGNS